MADPVARLILLLAGLLTGAFSPVIVAEPAGAQEPEPIEAGLAPTGLPYAPGLNVRITEPALSDPSPGMFTLPKLHHTVSSRNFFRASTTEGRPEPFRGSQLCWLPPPVLGLVGRWCGYDRYPVTIKRRVVFAITHEFFRVTQQVAGC